MKYNQCVSHPRDSTVSSQVQYFPLDPMYFSPKYLEVGKYRNKQVNIPLSNIEYCKTLHQVLKDIISNVELLWSSAGHFSSSSSPMW